MKNPQRPLKTAEIDILRAKAEGWLTPLGPRASASVNLVDAKASIFDLTLGAGVTTAGGRVKNDSLTVTVPGRGLGATVGRKIGVNAYGNYIGVDLGRLLLPMTVNIEDHKMFNKTCMQLPIMC